MTDPLIVRHRGWHTPDHTTSVSLLATKTAAGASRFDIHLQGAAETVFFDI